MVVKVVILVIVLVSMGAAARPQRGSAPQTPVLCPLCTSADWQETRTPADYWKEEAPRWGCPPGPPPDSKAHSGESGSRPSALLSGPGQAWWVIDEAARNRRLSECCPHADCSLTRRWMWLPGLSAGSPHAESCRLQASGCACLLPALLLLNGEELEYGFPLTFILPINGLLDSQ